MVQFALNQTEIANGYNNAAANPYDPMRDSAAGFFEGSLTALPTGFEQGGAEAALLFADKEKEPAIQDYIKSIKPDPLTTGWLGNVLQGVGSIIPTATVGTIATLGNPMGGALAVAETKGYAAKKELESQGVDEATATKAMVVEGVTQGLGVLAPASVGGNVATRIATGAGINVGVGAVQRGATGKILEANGYKEMADQYRVVDGMQMLTDAIIGGGFGALHTEGAKVESIHEPLPSEVDAALAANNIHQLEIESAPGIPADIATRNAHVEAMDIATEQVLRGEPVDIADRLSESSFLPKSDNTEVRSAMEEALQENSFNIPIENNKTPTSIVDPIKISPFETRPSVRELPKDNYTKALSEYAPIMYREAEASHALELMPYGNIAAEPGEVFLADSTDLATGQGKNKGGIQIAFDTRKLQGRINQGKPTWGESFRQGFGEYLARNNRQSDYQKAVVAVRIPDNLKLSTVDAAMFKRTLDTLEKNGWGKNKNDGFTEYSKPNEKLPAENTTTKETTASSKGGLIPESGVAKSIISEKPDLKITDEDGNVVTASEALAKADQEIAQAQKDKSLFEAAVNCFIRNGA